MNQIASEPQSRLLAPLAAIPACQVPIGNVDWFPAVDILEDGAEYLFVIDLPGVESESIRIDVKENAVLISGKRPLQNEKTCLRVERAQGSFERKFELPENASRTELSSTLEKGVLELHVSKVAAQPDTETARPVLPPPGGAPRLRLRIPALR